SLARRIDRRPERYRDGTGPFVQGALRPKIAGIMRDWKHRHAELDREACAARLVFGARAGPDPRALGIDDEPESLPEALAALPHNLLHRVGAGLPVDRDRRGERERPAKERDRQQLLLGDEGEMREVLVEGERLPRRAVLGHDDMRRHVAACRNVSGADRTIANAADPARTP